MSDLYHFTCDHGHEGLQGEGLVRPNFHPLIGVALAWFTDDPEPSRYSVGLTSESGLLSCDRMQYRYEVIDDRAHVLIRRWLGSIEQAKTNIHTQADLHRFSDPSRWFIATQPVLVGLPDREDNEI